MNRREEKVWAAYEQASGRLTWEQENFLALLLRSPDAGDGWREVSSWVWQVVEHFGRKELLEVEKREDGGRIRLSERGKIVVDYILGG